MVWVNISQTHLVALIICISSECISYVGSQKYRFVAVSFNQDGIQ
jgi:hypothetical protein